MAKTVICVATPLYPPDIGGPATHVILLENSLSRDQYELRLVTFRDVRSLPKIIRHIAYVAKVMRAGKTANFIYALDPVSVGFPALLASKWLKKPFVLRVGGDYAWEQGVQRFGVRETLDEFVVRPQHSFSVRVLQTLQSYVARHAKKVIAPSEYLAKIIATWGVSPANISVIYSQPDSIATLSRSEARKKLNIREDEEVVLTAGRLVPWKGFEGVIDAIGKIRSNRPVRLVIVGEGPSRGELEAHIAFTHSERFVALQGQLPRRELAVWLAAADVFVLNTKYEGLSHAILEAFAVRTPVITTPIGGNIELIEDGKTGVLVRHNDTDALAAAIERVLIDRAFAAAIAERAWQSLERFNAIHALQTLDALSKTI